VKIGFKDMALAVGTAFGAVVIGTAPTALADPVVPVPPPPPPPFALAEPVVPVPPPPPPTEIPAQPLADPAAPPTEAPHLYSPENLPPGTSAVPVGPPQGRGLAYLRELWHAVQTQEVSGADALLLLTQRPMNPGAAPPRGLPPGPQPALPPAPLPPAETPVPPETTVPAEAPVPPTP
jgi:hypothetical protein